MHLPYLFHQALIRSPFRQEAVHPLLAMGKHLRILLAINGDESKVSVIGSSMFHLLNGRLSTSTSVREAWVFRSGIHQARWSGKTFWQSPSRISWVLNKYKWQTTHHFTVHSCPPCWGQRFLRKQQLLNHLGSNKHAKNAKCVFLCLLFTLIIYDTLQLDTRPIIKHCSNSRGNSRGKSNRRRRHIVLVSIKVREHIQSTFSHSAFYYYSLLSFMILCN